MALLSGLSVDSVFFLVVRDSKKETNEVQKSIADPLSIAQSIQAARKG